MYFTQREILLLLSRVTADLTPDLWLAVRGFSSLTDLRKTEHSDEISVPDAY